MDNIILYTSNCKCVECAQDGMSRYCGDMIRDQNFNDDVQSMITTCNGTNDCSGDCQTAIENVSTVT